jgi:hypothetical protein
MVGKYIKHKGLDIFAAGVLVLVVLLSVAGCKAETVTTTVTEKSTLASTITKTETSTVKNTATVTETKTVTASPTTTTTKTTTSATSTATTSIVPNEQSQQITSADGKVKTLKHELVDGWSTSPYGMYVAGVVKNLTDTNVTAEVTIQFYDKNKALLGTETLKLDMAAGRSLPFQIFAGLIGVGAGTSYGHFVTSYVIAVTTV